MDREEVVQEVAQALARSGCIDNQGCAEIAVDVALPPGPYGYCASTGCRNQATTDIGFPACAHCYEAVNFGATVATANSELAQYGLRLKDHWLEDLKAVLQLGIVADTTDSEGEPL